MSKKLVIIGASGHGKVVADIAKKNGYHEIVFLDDDENIHECGGYPVIGRSGNNQRGYNRWNWECKHSKENTAIYSGKKNGYTYSS